MPLIGELINEKTKNKLMNMKNDFVGQTPNLNSSLGANAFVGEKKVLNFYDATTGMWMDDLIVPTPPAAVDTSTGTAGTDPSKLDSFWTKNQNIISGAVDSLSGLFGSKPTATTYTPTAAPAKSGMPTWAWILIVIVVIAIIFLIVRKMNK